MEWYYASNGQQAGPVSQEALAEMFRNGTVKSTDLVWSESLTEWTPIGKVPAFASAAPAPAPADAPPPLSAQVPVSPAPHSPYPHAGAVSSGRRADSLAITTFVLGLLTPMCCGILTGIPAIICGHIALSRISKNPDLGGKGLAIAGLVIGYIGTLFSIIYTIWVFSTGGFDEMIKAIEEAKQSQ